MTVFARRDAPSKTRRRRNAKVAKNEAKAEAARAAESTAKGPPKGRPKGLKDAR